jgi:hypothetical protein
VPTAFLARLRLKPVAVAGHHAVEPQPEAARAWTLRTRRRPPESSGLVEDSHIEPVKRAHKQAKLGRARAVIGAAVQFGGGLAGHDKFFWNLI